MNWENKNKLFGKCQTARRMVPKLKISQIQDPLAFEDNSTITTNSRQSSLVEREQYISKIRHQRFKIEKMLIKYETQKSCINELQVYIDELETKLNQKDREIQRLNMQITKRQNTIQHDLTTKKNQFITTNNDQVMVIVREQLERQQKERRKWEKQKSILEQHITEDKQEFEDQITDLLNEQAIKWKQNEIKWIDKQKRWKSQIQAIQLENSQLKLQIQKLKSILSEANELKQIIDLRLQLQINQNQHSMTMNQGVEKDILSQQLQKSRYQIKQLRREMIKYKSQLSNIKTDTDLIISECKCKYQTISKQKLNLQQKIEKMNFQALKFIDEKDCLIQQIKAYLTTIDQLNHNCKYLELELFQLKNQCQLRKDQTILQIRQINKIGNIFKNIQPCS